MKKEKMIQELQENNTQFLEQPEAGFFCPQCGLNELNEEVAMNALSRHERGIYICSECGTAEALRDMTGSPLKLSEWYFFTDGKEWKA